MREHVVFNTTALKTKLTYGHYNDVIMGAIASQITSLTIDCLLNRLFRCRSNKTSLRVTGLCAGNSPGTGKFLHKWPATRKIFPFDDVIMDNINMQVPSYCPTTALLTFQSPYLAVGSAYINSLIPAWITSIRLLKPSKPWVTTSPGIILWSYIPSTKLSSWLTWDRLVTEPLI